MRNLPTYRAAFHHRDLLWYLLRSVRRMPTHPQEILQIHQATRGQQMAKMRITEVTCDFCGSVLGHFQQSVDAQLRDQGCWVTQSHQFCNREHHLAFLREKNQNQAYVKHIEAEIAKDLPQRKRKK